MQDKIPTNTQNTSEIDEDFAGILESYANGKVSQCHAVSNGKSVVIQTQSSGRDFILSIYIMDVCNNFGSSHKKVATLNFNLDRFSYAGNKLFNTDLTLVSVENNVLGELDETDLYGLISEVNPAFNQLSSFINDKMYWTIKLDPSLPQGSYPDIELPPIIKLLDSTTPSSRSEAAETYRMSMASI